MGSIQKINKAIQVCDEPLLNWILFLTLVLFFLFNIFSLFIQKMFEEFMTVNSLFIASFAVIVTLIIASNQDKQLGELDKIGKDTREITKELQTESKTRQIVEAFFNIKDSRGKPYQLLLN